MGGTAWGKVVSEPCNLRYPTESTKHKDVIPEFALNGYPESRFPRAQGMGKWVL
jgi:hypothetical protein